MMKTEIFGAPIERGRIVEIENGMYRVASADRHGITTPLLEALDSTELDVGNAVYFFLFQDGTGKILCKM